MCHIFPLSRKSFFTDFQRAMFDLSAYGTPIASLSTSTSLFFVKWKIYSWQLLRNLLLLTGLKCPTLIFCSGIEIDFIQSIVFCTFKFSLLIAFATSKAFNSSLDLSPILKNNEPLSFRTRLHALPKLCIQS